MAPTAAVAGSTTSCRSRKRFAPPAARPKSQSRPTLTLRRQDAEQLEVGKSILKTPLTIGTRKFEHGLGTHATSRIVIRSPKPIERFSAWVGVDHNERTRGGAGSIVFSVSTDKGELFRSKVLRGGQAPVKIDVAAGGATTLYLNVDDAGDGIECDHADWADAVITLEPEAKPCASMIWRCVPANLVQFGSQPIRATRNCRSSTSRAPKAAAFWSASAGRAVGRPSSRRAARNWKPKRECR